jgi:hypothetical protein
MEVNLFLKNLIGGHMKIKSPSTTPGPVNQRIIHTLNPFNGKYRDECLNVHWFLSLEDAQEKTGDETEHDDILNNGDPRSRKDFNSLPIAVTNLPITSF